MDRGHPDRDGLRGARVKKTMKELVRLSLVMLPILIPMIVAIQLFG